MAVIKKVVALSGEEYNRLKIIEAAYNAQLAAQQSEAEAQAAEAEVIITEEGTDTAATGEV